VKLPHVCRGVHSLAIADGVREKFEWRWEGVKAVAESLIVKY